MKIIEVKEPESGEVRQLGIHPVKNYASPGWVVFIPHQKNIMLFFEGDKWDFTPKVISPLYAQRIGEKLRELRFVI